MARIIVASHGTVAQSLVEAAGMIAGPAATRVLAVELTPDDNLEGLRRRLESEIDGIEGTLILVDLFGGTPANAAAWASRGRRIEVVSGVNLPMLLEVLSQGECVGIEQLARVAIASGRQGIENVREALQSG